MYDLNPEIHIKMQSYARKIRNTNKRAYAFGYIGFLDGRRSEPEKGILSSMTTCCVRNDLHAMMRGETR